MSLAPVLPDAPLVVGRILRATPAVTDLVSYRVGTRPYTAYPYVMVRRIGGLPVAPGWDAARLQVDVRAPTEEAASLIVRTLQATLLALPWTPAALQSDAVITDVRQQLGVQHLLEPPDDRPRALFDVVATLRPPLS